MLVIPAIRTFYLSFYDRDSDEFVGVDNYRRCSPTRRAWTRRTGRTCSPAACSSSASCCSCIAVVVGDRSPRSAPGEALEVGNPTVAPLVVGVLLVCLRRVHQPPRHDRSTTSGGCVTVVFLSTAARSRRRRAGRQPRSSEKLRQVADLHADGHLARRRVGHLALRVPAARHSSRADRPAQRDLGRLGRLSAPGQRAPDDHRHRRSSASCCSRCRWRSLARRLVKRQWGALVAARRRLSLLVGWLFIRFAGIIGGGIGGFDVNADGKTVAADRSRSSRSRRSTTSG